MIRLLDHGFARLVSYVQPVPDPLESPLVRDGEEIYRQVGRRDDSWSGDLEIIRNARVSHDADWRSDGTVIHEAHCLSILPPMSDGTVRQCNCVPRTASDARLMHYLYSHLHSTPFESMVFTFEVQAPIFVFRQWHRHRTWSYNEVSARYTELPSSYYVPGPEDIGTQSSSNKQGRVMSASQDYAERERQRLMVEGFDLEAKLAHRCYQDRLAENVPREIARINLPLSTYSRMFGTVDLWNLFHFISLRDHSHAQYEIRVYAQALKELIRPIVPNAVAAFDRYKRIMLDSESQCVIDVTKKDHLVTINGKRYLIVVHPETVEEISNDDTALPGVR